MKINQFQNHYFGLSYIATGVETSSKYFQSRTVIPAGDPGPPKHFHSREDEGFYVESGVLTFIVDDKEINLTAGEFLNIEKGEIHSWRNDSDEDVALIVTFSPAGIEHMFIELEKDMNNIREIGKKYGTEFLI